MPTTRNGRCRSNCCRCELAFGLGGWRVRNCLARGRRMSASRVSPSATLRRPASALRTLCRFAASTAGDRKASSPAARPRPADRRHCAHSGPRPRQQRAGRVCGKRTPRLYALRPAPRELPSVGGHHLTGRSRPRVAALRCPPTVRIQTQSRRLALAPAARPTWRGSPAPFAICNKRVPQPFHRPHAYHYPQDSASFARSARCEPACTTPRCRCSGTCVAGKPGGAETLAMAWVLMGYGTNSGRLPLPGLTASSVT
jgi:hypothetical protein